ncbi:hypothetical protein OROHE_013446 [Orobanche hederae]
MENTNQSSFWQFSDNLRLETSSLANLFLNDSIWSTSYAAKRPAEKRRNFDFRNGSDGGSNFHAPIADDLKPDFSNLGFSNDVWKAPVDDRLGGANVNYSGFGPGLNGGFNKGIYPSAPSMSFNSYSKDKSFAVNGRVNKGGRNEEVNSGGKYGKKNKGNKESNNKDGNYNNSNSNGNGENKSAVDKRFKTLPPAESLPRKETIGGYIFVCNNDTMSENLKRQLFGLPPRYRDSVRAITPGLPLFLYNYSTHQLHGIFEAASFGGTNIDPSAWEDKKNPGESRFPAQVRVVTRKICEPMEEDSFRPILHHYDGPKFRLELNIPEVLALLDVFVEENNKA